jgi:hypothetical protein
MGEPSARAAQRTSRCESSVWLMRADRLNLHGAEPKQYPFGVEWAMCCTGACVSSELVLAVPCILSACAVYRMLPLDYVFKCRVAHGVPEARCFGLDPVHRVPPLRIPIRPLYGWLACPSKPALIRHARGRREVAALALAYLGARNARPSARRGSGRLRLRRDRRSLAREGSGRGMPRCGNRIEHTPQFHSLPDDVGLTGRQSVGQEEERHESEVNLFPPLTTVRTVSGHAACGM